MEINAVKQSWLKSTSKADGLPREEYRGSLWVRSDGKQLSTSGHAGLLS